MPLTASQSPGGSIRPARRLDTRYLDHHGVLDAEVESAARENPRFAALLLPEREPTPLAGRLLVVVDSAGAP
jgi:hypothetical protein